MHETKTVKEWKEKLQPAECEALDDMNYNNQEKRLSATEVFDQIVEWEGGLASGYHCRSIISRVYGIEL